MWATLWSLSKVTEEDSWVEVASNVLASLETWLQRKLFWCSSCVLSQRQPVITCWLLGSVMCPLVVIVPLPCMLKESSMGLTAESLPIHIVIVEDGSRSKWPRSPVSPRMEGLSLSWTIRTYFITEEVFVGVACIYYVQRTLFYIFLWEARSYHLRPVCESFVPWDEIIEMFISLVMLPQNYCFTFYLTIWLPVFHIIIESVVPLSFLLSWNHANRVQSPLC